MAISDVNNLQFQEGCEHCDMCGGPDGSKAGWGSSTSGSCKDEASVFPTDAVGDIKLPYLLLSLLQKLLESLIIQHPGREVGLALGLQLLQLLPQATQGLQLIVESTLPCEGRLEVQLQVQ